MNKKPIVLSFLFSFIFLSSIIAVLGASEGGWGSGWQNLLPTTSISPQEDLMNWLNMFGIPSVITKDYLGILYYIIIPTLTFAIVLKAILIDEIVVSTMKISAFSGWKGWVFVLLIIGFLIPTGILGRAAMWIYATAGILTVYGFGALLIIQVINRFIVIRSGRAWAGLVIAILGAALLAFIIPGLGIIIGVIAVLMAVVGYRKGLKPVTQEAREMMTKEVEREADEILKEIQTQKEKLTKDDIDYLERELKKVLDNFRNDRITKSVAHMQFGLVKQELKKRLGTVRREPYKY